MHSTLSQLTRKIVLLIFSIFNFTLLFCQDYAPELPTASKVAVYKKVDDVELKAWIFNPVKHQAGSKKPAIVFYFGGGWVGGTPAQFVKHCEYLSARGLVAITVDYRVQKRQGVKAYKCVADAKSAIRWMRTYADSLGIDPNKIIAAGGSAGGHLAASTALLTKFDEASDDSRISCVPNALALFNPVLVLGKVEGQFELPPNRIKNLEDRLGTSLESMSPYHYLSGDLPPCLIFHGTNDKTVPYSTAQLFHEHYSAKGNDCRLVAYPEEGHGFFNFGRKKNGPFVSTIKHLDDFLVGMGYLSPLPEFQIK